MHAAILLGAALATLVFYLYNYLNTTSKPPRGSHFPPSPPGHPIVGNLFSVPAKHVWLQFYEWAKSYGPLYRLNLAGSEHYIVSTERVGNELLRERGNVHSSREQLPAAVQLLGGNLRPLFWPHGDLFRRGRKLMHQLCMPAAAATYEPMQELESARLLVALISEPAKYEHWYMRSSSSLIFRLGFGRVMKDEGDEVQKRLFQELQRVEEVAKPGAYLVDMFPSLLAVPDWLAPWKKQLKEWHKEEKDLMRGLLLDVKERMTVGEASDCWEKTFLERKDEYGLTDDQGAYVIGTLFEAGAGTTAAALMGWTLAMTLHPEELAKLQKELDEVVGDKHLPAFTDMPNLPRVRAVVKEVLRWHPVTAGGLPHYSTKDDVYSLDGQDFFIPAGTNIHANQWAIHREEALYPDPDSFRPERWLEESWPTYRAPLTQFPNIQNFSAFGFGRRICPGQHIAERSLYIAVARIAWACDIRKKRNSQGKEIPVPEYDYTLGFSPSPNHFEFDLRARSAERERIAREALKAVMAEDSLRQ